MPSKRCSFVRKSGCVGRVGMLLVFMGHGDGGMGRLRIRGRAKRSDKVSALHMIEGCVKFLVSVKPASATTAFTFVSHTLLSPVSLCFCPRS